MVREGDSGHREGRLKPLRAPAPARLKGEDRGSWLRPQRENVLLEKRKRWGEATWERERIKPPNWAEREEARVPATLNGAVGLLTRGIKVDGGERRFSIVKENADAPQSERGQKVRPVRLEARGRRQWRTSFAGTNEDPRRFLAPSEDGTRQGKIRVRVPQDVPPPRGVGKDPKQGEES